MKYHPIFVSLAAAALYSTASFAADEIGAPVGHKWSGVYAGVQAGGAWASADDGADNVGMNGGAIGGYLGLNWQSGNWVYGVEGDVNYTSNDGSIYGIDIGTEWQGALRARLGYAFDRLLVYGAGGLAISEVFVDAPPILSEKETFTGWTVGGGVEYAFTDNWSTRLDYRYSDYGSSNFGLMGVTEIDVTEHALRVGVGYRF
jgi:outer membrane immunogenic protein